MNEKAMQYLQNIEISLQEQILSYDFYEAIVFVIVGMFLILTSLNSAYLFCKYCKDTTSSSDTQIVISGVTSLFSFVVGVASIVTYSSIIIKISIAPKLYLIEYFAGVIK